MLLVTGMHRAGTSALCAALAAAGARFGTDLLEPIAGVNDEGFWEAGELVAINEALLAQAGYHWYTVDAAAAAIDWSAPAFDGLRDRAGQWLQDVGSGGAGVEAIKDPRLCITLPFWCALAGQLEIAITVCLIQRAPMEIARSLLARDDLPIGYGLRLTASYLESALCHAPVDTVYVTYADLLAEPAAAITPLAERLQLTPDSGSARDAVRGELRHHAADAGAPGVFHGLPARAGLAEYLARLRAPERAEDDLAAFAEVLVEKNRALTALGEAHQLALDTIDERDSQIADFDARLQALGKEHGELLAKINGLTGKPLLGPLLRVYLRYAIR